MPVGVFCPDDGVELQGPHARYCHRCGQAICHPCPNPNCRRLLPVSAEAAKPFRRCPHCDQALWQCRSCRWIALPGTARCERDGCPENSLKPDLEQGWQLSGDSGRSGACRIPASSDRAHAFLSSPPNFTRLDFDGPIRGIVPTSGGMCAFGDRPGRLWSLSLPQEFQRTLSKDRKEMIPLRYSPSPKALDPLASYAEKLYLLGSDGAHIREGNQERPLHPPSSRGGAFVAQCIHRQGWLLIEESLEGGAIVHRVDLDGHPLAPPVPLRNRKLHLPWTLPVADDTAAYLPDDRGNVWVYPWSGEDPRVIETSVEAISTLLLAPDGLYVLPANQPISGCRVSVGSADEEVTPVAPTERNALAAAISDSARYSQLWVGAQTEHKMACINRRNPAYAPELVSGSPDAPVHLCTVQGPNDATAVIGVLKGNNRDMLQGWFTDLPVRRTAPFQGILPQSDREQSPRLLVSNAWLGVWNNVDGGAYLLLYYLA